MKSRGRIVLLGAGGHGQVCLDLIQAVGGYTVAGVLDAALPKGRLWNGIRTLGNDDSLPSLYKSGLRKACVGVGGIEDLSQRAALYRRVKRAGFEVPALIHPSASLAVRPPLVAPGVQIMMGARIQVQVQIGENTVINTAAVVEHDCRIGRDVQIAPGAVLCGGVHIGDHSFIGAGAIVIQGIHVGRRAFVAAGAVVIRDVPDEAHVTGVPAR